MELVLFIGLQATGKSTFYNDRFANSHLRVSLDVVRTRRREEGLIKACLKLGQRCVVDNTNPTRAERAKYFAWAQEARFRVIGYYFQSQIDDALARNRQREGKQRIPDKGVLATYRKMELPDRSEGFDELYYVTLVGGGFQIAEWTDEV